jgi:hypothetical protein
VPLFNTCLLVGTLDSGNMMATAFAQYASKLEDSDICMPLHVVPLISLLSLLYLLSLSLSLSLLLKEIANH